MILSSILPGLREIRAPVAAGFLWMLFLWGLFGSHVPDSVHASGLLKNFYDLGSLVGALGVGVALSFVAYLIGSLTEGTASRLVNLGFHRMRRRPSVAEVGYYLKRDQDGNHKWHFGDGHPPDMKLESPPLPEVVLSMIWDPPTARGTALARGYLIRYESRRNLEAALTDRLSSLRHRLDPLVGEAIRSIWPRVVSARERYPNAGSLDWIDVLSSSDLLRDARNWLKQDIRHDALVESIDLLVDRYERAVFELPQVLVGLIAQEPELFSYVDAARAEADFRLAVVPPLVALSALAGIDLSLWWLSALIPIAGLAASGIAQQMVAGDRLVGAYVDRTNVEMPFVRRLQSLVSEMAPREAPAKPATGASDLADVPVARAVTESAT